MRFFVTGGTRGIGAQMVLDIVSAGHDVAFTFLERDSEASNVIKRAADIAPLSRCRAYKLDVRDSDAVDLVTETAIDDFTEIDVVVCNAGINRIALAIAMTNEEWKDVIDTNLTGAFYVCRAFLPLFLQHGRGRFILISSVGMHGVSGQIGYSASKAGLMGLAQGLAKEYGAKGITANALVLGLFGTDLSEASLSESSRRFWLETCPAQRIGRLSEVSAAVLFLASVGADFINGQLIGINGGLDRVK